MAMVLEVKEPVRDVKTANCYVAVVSINLFSSGSSMF